MGEEALRKYVKEVLLQEEIVTIFRDDKSTIYDATFDKEGNVLSAKPSTLNSEDQKLIEKISELTEVPPSLIHKIISSGEVEIQRDASSVEDVVSYMKNNSVLRSAMLWKPTNRAGRGEAAVKLAFKFSDAKEPDFVSADGGVKLSIKYFAEEGSGSIKSGETSSRTVRLTSELQSVVGIEEFGGSYSGRNLDVDLNKIIDQNEKMRVIEDCKAIIDELKIALTVEHGADAILGFDSKDVFSIDQSNAPAMLQIKSIRNGGQRVEFYGPNVSADRMTLEKVLNKAAAV